MICHLGSRCLVLICEDDVSLLLPPTWLPVSGWAYGDHILTDENLTKAPRRNKPSLGLRSQLVSTKRDD